MGGICYSDWLQWHWGWRLWFSSSIEWFWARELVLCSYSEGRICVLIGYCDIGGVTIVYSGVGAGTVMQLHWGQELWFGWLVTMGIGRGVGLVTVIFEMRTVVWLVTVTWGWGRFVVRLFAVALAENCFSWLCLFERWEVVRLVQVS